MSRCAGAGYRCWGEIPRSRAVIRANGLNEEPAWRPVAPPVARFSRANFCLAKKSLPPTMARISPVLGSITVMAP